MSDQAASSQFGQNSSRNQDQRPKKKRAPFKDQDAYSDGYDSEGYKDDDEREKLFKLDEVERMNILEKRLDARQQRNFHREVAEKARITGSVANPNILNNSAISGIDTSKRNQVDQDRIQHRKEQENRREKYSKDSHSQADQYHMSEYVPSQDEQKITSHSGHNHDQRDKNVESGEFKYLVQQLTLPFDFLNKLILRSNFKELVRGAYVKAKIGSRYEIYKVEDFKADNQCMFVLNNGIKRREIDMKFISNQSVAQVELCTYYDQNHKNEDLAKLKEKKRRFDDQLMKKQDKSEKEKFAEIDANLTKKISEGYFEDAANLNANELQTFLDFLRDRLLEIETKENTPGFGGESNKKEAVELMRLKKKYQHNMEIISKKIKLVKHQFVPICTKNVLEIGSKISEQALNKKNAKIKDKLALRKQKIEKLQLPYLSLETKFNMLSSHATAFELKESIRKNHLALHLSHEVAKNISSIDSSDANILTLLHLKK